ncbi:MAG: hypothetical protein AB7E24_00410 [Novosphingobium sp.]
MTGVRFAVSIVAQSRTPIAQRGGVPIRHALAIFERPAGEVEAEVRTHAIGQYEARHSDWEVIGCLCEEVPHG